MNHVLGVDRVDGGCEIGHSGVAKSHFESDKGGIEKRWR